MSHAGRSVSPSRQLRAQRANVLRERGFSREQIADTWEADYPEAGPRTAFRWAHNMTHQDVADKWNQMEVGEPTMTKSRIYEFEAWPHKGRRPSVPNLRTLARIYGTTARRLLTDEEYARYDDTAQLQIEPIDYRPSRDISLSSQVDDCAAAPKIAHSGQLTRPQRAADLQTINGLRGVLSAHVDADAMLGSRLLVDAVRGQVPVIDKACRMVRGKDQMRALRFAIEFIEFCGWLHQDSGDFPCAQRWTNKALDYAMELGDHRIIAYILMRKSNIATDAGDPVTALGLTRAALKSANSLTPRLRSVVLRQQANAHAAMISAFEETARDSEFGKDSENAMIEALAGVNQQENDSAPYCTPSYVEMEIGSSLLLLGKPKAALPVFEASRIRWSDPKQARDNALCLARLATAHADAGDCRNASDVAAEAISAAEGLGSWRVVTQLATLNGHLEKWKYSPTIAEAIQRLNALINSFGYSSSREGCK